MVYLSCCPLEVGNQIVYNLTKITPYGGIPTMGIHAWNLNIYAMYDLDTYLGIWLSGSLILEF